MKNITSFNEFKLIKEDKEFVNDTSWNESLLGKAVNGIFRSVFKLFNFGFTRGSFAYLKNQIVKECLKGVILWADKNNVNLETGLPEEGSNLLKKTEITDEVKPEQTVTVEEKPEEEKPTITFTEEENKYRIKTITELQKIIQKNKIGIENLKRQKNTIEDKIKNGKASNQEKKRYPEIDDDIKNLKNENDVIISTTKKKKSEIEQGITDTKKVLSNIVTKNAELQKKAKEKTISEDEENLLVNNNNKIIELQKEILANEKALEDILKVEEHMVIYDYETLNEARKVGRLFSRDKRETLNKDIKDTDIKKINFAKIAQVIDKPAATKLVDVNKILTYHLTAERLYTDKENKVDKKEELTWQKKLASIKSEFKDLLDVDKIDPTSPSFLIDKTKVDSMRNSENEEKNNLFTSLELANDTRSRVKTLGLNEKVWSVKDIQTEGSEKNFILTFKWNYRTKKKPEFKSVVAAKYIKMGDYDVFAIIDTFSKDFYEKYNIEEGIKVENNGDLFLEKFLYGNKFVTDKGTFETKSIKDKIAYFVIPKMKLPVSTLQEHNSVYIFDILNSNGKIDLFVPLLTNIQKMETKLTLLTEQIKDQDNNPLNNIIIEIFSVYNTKEETDDNYINQPNIDTNLITKYANELKAYFQKIEMK
jgi:hypothetical protein